MGTTRRKKSVTPQGRAPFRPDQEVVVVDGLAAGERGVVRSRSELTFGGERMWVVDLSPTLPGRTIRESFLRCARCWSAGKSTSFTGHGHPEAE